MDTKIESKRNFIVESCKDIEYYSYNNQWLVRGKKIINGLVYNLWINALPTEEEVKKIYPEANPSIFTKG